MNDQHGDEVCPMTTGRKKSTHSTPRTNNNVASILPTSGARGNTAVVFLDLLHFFTQRWCPWGLGVWKKMFRASGRLILCLTYEIRPILLWKILYWARGTCVYRIHPFYSARQKTKPTTPRVINPVGLSGALPVFLGSQVDFDAANQFSCSWELQKWWICVTG